MRDCDLEPDIDMGPEAWGYVHEDNIPDLQFCSEMLENIIEAIYVTGDVGKLEDSLDELTNQFDLRLPRTDPLLEKKDLNLNLLRAFAGFTKEYAEAITQKEYTCNLQ